MALERHFTVDLELVSTVDPDTGQEELVPDWEGFEQSLEEQLHWIKGTLLNLGGVVIVAAKRVPGERPGEYVTTGAVFKFNSWAGPVLGGTEPPEGQQHDEPSEAPEEPSAEEALDQVPVAVGAEEGAED